MKLLKALLLAAAPLVLVVAAYAEWSTPTDEYGKFVGPGQLKSYTAVTTTDIDTTAIAATLAPGRTFELLAVRATVADGGDTTAATSNNIQIKIDSYSGAAYDHIIFLEDVSTVGTGIQVVYDPPMPFVATDELDITFDGTSTGDDDLLGIELVYRYIGAAP